MFKIILYVHSSTITSFEESMASQSSLIALVFFLFIATFYSSQGLLLPPKNLIITNNLGDGLGISLHCHSPDGDFGEFYLTDGEKKEFFVAKRRLWCDVGKQRPICRGNTTLYDVSAWGYWVEWSIKRTGIYTRGRTRNPAAPWQRVYEFPSI